MSKTKYTLEFVNDGKPFELPDWTVKKHEQALDRLIKKHGEAAVDKQDRLLRTYIIYETLVEIDPDVNIEEIENMHPDNQVELFSAVYTAGKKDIHFHDKPSKRKSQK